MMFTSRSTAIERPCSCGAPLLRLHLGPLCSRASILGDRFIAAWLGLVCSGCRLSFSLATSRLVIRLGRLNFGNLLLGHLRIVRSLFCRLFYLCLGSTARQAVLASGPFIQLYRPVVKG